MIVRLAKAGAIVVIALVTVTAHAAPSTGCTGSPVTCVYSPPKGSVERKAMLDAIRPIVEKHMGQRVEFVVQWLRAGGSWGFAVVDYGIGATDVWYEPYCAKVPRGLIEVCPDEVRP